MNKNVLTIGMVVGAIATFLPVGLAYAETDYQVQKGKTK
jgi:hypothetical protein